MNKFFIITKHLALSLTLIALVPLHGAANMPPEEKRQRGANSATQAATSQDNALLQALRKEREERYLKRQAIAPAEGPDTASVAITASSIDEQTDCPFCKDPLATIAPEDLITLHIGQEIRPGTTHPTHTFCRKCLRSALKQQPKPYYCPLCSTKELSAEEIRALQLKTAREAILEAEMHGDEALVAQLLEIPGINTPALQEQLAEIRIELATGANLVMLAADAEQQAPPVPQRQSLEELTWEAAACNNAVLLRSIATIPSVNKVRMFNIVLLAAISRQHTDLVEYALSNGADVNVVLDQRDPLFKKYLKFRRSPLMLAIIKGNLQIINTLLAQPSINVNLIIEFDRTKDLRDHSSQILIPPAHYSHTAFKEALNSPSYSPEIVHALLQVPSLEKNPTLLLFHGVKSQNLPLIQQAVSDGADINAYEDFSPYPWMTGHFSILRIAVENYWGIIYNREYVLTKDAAPSPKVLNRMKKVIRYLLTQPAIARSLDGENGEFTQREIVKIKDIELIMHLIHFGYSTLKALAVEICCTHNQILVERVLNSGISPVETLNNGQNRTTLLDSCIAAPEKIKLLLANAAQRAIAAAPAPSLASQLLLQTQHNGWTPLHLAAYTGNLAEVTRLLAAGAKANAKTTYGTSVLTAAIFSNNADLIIPLATAGANVNENLCYTDQPAIFYANDRRNIGMIHALVAAGADINIRDKYGWTALSHAMSSGADAAYIHALRAAGADTNIIDKHGYTLEDIFNKYNKRTMRVILGVANPGEAQQAVAPVETDSRIIALTDPCEVTIVPDPALVAIQRKHGLLAGLLGSPLDLHSWE